ncbi:SDR family NAD(P)-dependent oxidoreductase [Microbacteriaceae bacterium VKM Ac-2855]|nr:SDR family NAD(P)-dependent oxidoreductase [Microbacteriaceae bacterium VKM Ac-2855]
MTTALITGATSGIGAAFARALAKRGHRLVLVARDAQRLQQRAAEFEALGSPHVETITADLGDRGDQERVRMRVADPVHPIDVLVNNAGFAIPGSAARPDIAGHDHALEVMVRTVYLLSGAAAESMTARGRGVIVNVSSIAGYVQLGPYSAAKAWMTSFTESLAVELRGTGVRAAALCPGWVRTEFHERGDVATASIPSFMWIEQDRLVEECLRDIARGAVISVPTKRFTAVALAAKYLPGPWLRRACAEVLRRR